MNARIFVAALLTALLLPRSAPGDVEGPKVLVDAAKDEGQVGEQADGLLGFVQATDDASLCSAVAEINAARTELYADVAERYGVDPAVVGAASFRRRFDAIPPGQWYRDAHGTWIRK